MASESAKIVNGFAATGICPYNSSAVPNEAFVHLKSTDAQSRAMVCENLLYKLNFAMLFL